MGGETDENYYRDRMRMRMGKKEGLGLNDSLMKRRGENSDVSRRKKKKEGLTDRDGETGPGINRAG